MEFQDFSFGSIRIDGVTYNDDVMIDRGEVHRRDKSPSRRFRSVYDHTPLSLQERIPWDCKCLVVGSGVDGKMPVLPEVRHEAERRKIELVVAPTGRAIERLSHSRPETTNAILHITC